MYISPSDFASNKIFPSKPYELNTGFIYGSLSMKVQNSVNEKESFIKLLDKFEEFLDYYQFILDDNCKLYKANSMDEHNKILDILENHEFFRNHHVRLSMEEDFAAELYCYNNDVYVNVLQVSRFTYPKLEWVFALQLNLLDLMEIPDFLDYQYEEIFEKNKKSFLRYVENMIIEFKDEWWFSVKCLDITNKYLIDEFGSSIGQYVYPIHPPIIFQNKNLKDGSQDSLQLNINENQHDSADTLKEEEAPDVPKYSSIHGNFNKKQVAYYFDLLKEIKNKAGKSILNSDEVEQLKEIGLSIPESISYPRFTLKIGKYEKFIVYHFIYKLWEANKEVPHNKREVYAKYIKDFFTNYDDTNLESIKTSLRDHSVAETLKTLIRNRLSEICKQNA